MKSESRPDQSVALRTFCAMLAIVAVLSYAGCVSAIGYESPDELGCMVPPANVFSKTGVELETARGDFFEKVVLEGGNLKISNDVVNLVSQSALEMQLLEYLQCRLEKRHQFTSSQATYLYQFNSFLTSHPTPQQIMEFKRDHPFPTN